MERSLEITTAIGCKNRCVYCPQDRLIDKYNRKSKINRLSFLDFKRFLSNVPKDVHLYFSGFSEPWSNSECTKMILHAYKNGYDISVFTTTVGMKISDIDIIKNIIFLDFVVHLPDDSENTQIKVSKDYLANIRKLLDSNMSNLSFNCKISSSKSKINFLLKNLFDEYKIDTSKFIGNVNTRAGNINVRKLQNKNKTSKPIRDCICLDGGVLLPNGDVFLCFMDYGLKHKLGNLSKDTFDKLIYGKEMLKIKEGLRDDSIDILCRNCEYAVQKKFSNHPFFEGYLYPYTTPLLKPIRSLIRNLRSKISR